MPEWKTVSISDLATDKGLIGGPFGSSLGSKDYTSSGIPVIRGTNLGSDLKFDPSDFVFVSETKLDRELSRNIALPGDVIFTQRGTLGQVGIVPPQPYDRYVISQSQMRLRVNRELAEPEFVYYQFKSTYMVLQINNHAITTGVPHINLGILGGLRFALPPLPIQQSICGLLGALDDKIAVNDRVTRTCDELRTLKLGTWIKSNPDTTRELPLSAVAEFINGRAFTKDATGTGRMVIRIAEINSGPGSSTVYNDIDVPDVHLARPGDVLFAWSGSLAITRWFRPEAIVNQHIFKVLPRDAVPLWLAFELLLGKLADFKAIAAGKATTMGHIQRHHLDDHVAMPDGEYIADLDAELGPLWLRALAAEQESLKLAELRDTLLPKLMSGEIRVRDAEKVVEDAT